RRARYCETKVWSPSSADRKSRRFTETSPLNVASRNENGRPSKRKVSLPEPGSSMTRWSRPPRTHAAAASRVSVKGVVSSMRGLSPLIRPLHLPERLLGRALPASCVSDPDRLSCVYQATPDRRKTLPRDKEAGEGLAAGVQHGAIESSDPRHRDELLPRHGESVRPPTRDRDGQLVEAQGRWFAVVHCERRGDLRGEIRQRPHRLMSAVAPGET